ncbi:MAG: histidine phosphatase family protein [Pseudomonadota bacterium]
MNGERPPRRVLIVRHAQAEREPPGGGPDKERPLSDHGEHEARLAGGRLQARGIILDLIVSSPATRAAGTARLLAKRLRYDAEAIQYELAIYNASRTTLLELLSDTDDGNSCVALVGHNPGLSELAATLSADPVAGLPTCGIIGLVLPQLQDWASLRPNTGKLEFTDFGRTTPT